MMSKKKNGLVIDAETADRITVCSLKDHLSYLEKEVKAHLKKGEYMHPEDLVESQVVLIPALKTVIKYYGG